MDFFLKFNINYIKVNNRFFLSLHYNDDDSHLFANWKKIFRSKANNKNLNFPTWFDLVSISDGFSNIESREVSLHGNVYDFSVD